MKKRIFSLIGSETGKGTIIIAIGNITNAFFSIVFVYFVSLFVSPFNFGLFSISCLTTWFLLQETFDFGLSNLIIRLSGKNIEKNKGKAFSYFKTIFLIRVIIGLSIFIIFLIGGNYFSTNVLHQSALFIPLLLVAFGEIGAMFEFSVLSMALVLKKFKLYAILYCFQGAGRLILLVILYYRNWLNLYLLIIVFISLPYLISLMAFILLPKEIWQSKTNKEFFREIFSYIKWLAFWGIFIAIANRINVYILIGIVGPEKAGIYNLAYLFASSPLLLTGSFSTAFLPKISRLENRAELRKALGKGLKAIFYLALLMIIIIFLGKFLIGLFLEKKYPSSSLIFSILMIGMIFIVLSVPANTTFWVLDRPKLFTLVSFIQLILALVLNLILVTKLGLIGAAISFSLVSFLICLLINYLVIKILKEKNS